MATTPNKSNPTPRWSNDKLLPPFDMHIAVTYNGERNVMAAPEAIRVVQYLFEAEELGSYKPTVWEANFLDGIGRILCSGKCDWLTEEQTTKLISMHAALHLGRFLPRQKPKAVQGPNETLTRSTASDTNA